MTKILKIVLIAVIFLFFTRPVIAQSTYVLPYPSFMPGSIFYKLHVIWEDLMKYWYFGNFGQFEYNLKLSDKYLVEAKTLFEYKQYLLGCKALQKSDKYFGNTSLFLILANREGKNIFQNKNLLKEVALKHIEELERIENIIPDNFIWQPENSLSTNLNLRQMIKKSIGIRKKSI